VSPRAATQRGMLLLGTLVMLAVIAAAGVHIGMGFAQERQRADEEELLFVGEQYRQAIESYWRSSPGGIRSWPTRLEDLLADNRFPQPRRHLRKLFRDPLAPEQDWGLVTLGTGIVGVYSRADGEPFRRSGFAQRQSRFADARTYEDWKFTAVVGLDPAATGKPATAPAPRPSSPITPNPPTRPRKPLP
jgi:type II secretory pathway pseudopilin PulG